MEEEIMTHVEARQSAVTTHLIHKALFIQFDNSTVDSWSAWKPKGFGNADHVPTCGLDKVYHPGISDVCVRVMCTARAMFVLDTHDLLATGLPIDLVLKLFTPLKDQGPHGSWHQHWQPWPLARGNSLAIVGYHVWTRAGNRWTSSLSLSLSPPVPSGVGPQRSLVTHILCLHTDKAKGHQIDLKCHIFQPFSSQNKAI